VWFDSGSSHEAVLARNAELGCLQTCISKAAIQHRGWFQSSLLIALGTREAAAVPQSADAWLPDRPRRRKMSKSVGNAIAPQDVIKESGAEISACGSR
jgi:isoleucyl-tRNA synthetase